MRMLSLFFVDIFKSETHYMTLLCFVNCFLIFCDVFLYYGHILYSYAFDSTYYRVPHSLRGIDALSECVFYTT